jgi:hypothetical protein
LIVLNLRLSPFFILCFNKEGRGAAAAAAAAEE